jgi:uncharacterized protein (DUF1697 family)
MPRYIALLRAINAGGRTVKMDVLRQSFQDMGFSGVTSFIASGNIIFETSARNTRLLEDRIEAGLMAAFGHEITPFIRTSPELVEIAAFKPFPNSHIRIQDQIGVIFLGSPVPRTVIPAIQALQTGTDEWRGRGRELYWLRHRSESGEIISMVPLEKVLDQPFTIRSTNTVQKLAEKYCRQIASPEFEICICSVTGSHYVPAFSGCNG